MRLVFLHIDKTAGTSFRESLMTEYGRSEFDTGVLYVPLNAFPGRWHEGKLQERIDIRVKNKEDVIISSNDYYISPAGHEATKLCVTDDTHLITFLRDPVDRVVSHYNYFIRKKEAIPTPHAYEWFNYKKPTLKEFASHPSFRNYMTQFICGPLDNMTAVIKGLDLEDFSFVGFVDDFKADFKKVAKGLGWSHDKPINANVSPKTRKPAKKTLEYIKEVNQRDYELYEAAKKLKKEGAWDGKF